MSAIWTNITSPSVKDPTRKTFAEYVVGNLAYLYNWLLGVLGTREVILNGSFESDADNDTVPDGWSITLYTGGSFSYETSTIAADGKSYHGKRSVKFTSPGGASNGGGWFESENVFEVSEGRSYELQFALKSTVVDVHNKVEIIWYDCVQAVISTVTVHDDATTNPTSWRGYRYTIHPPANARYAKLRFHACLDDDTTAGSTWYDDIRIQSGALKTLTVFDASGTWNCPAGVRTARIRVWGAGGGGAGNGVAGGGAGGFGEGVFTVIPGVGYTVTIGAAGTSSGSSNGTAGGTTSVLNGATTIISATGGGGGASSTGGSGGTSSATVNVTGGTGGSVGGHPGGGGGAGGVTTGQNGRLPAGGGGPGTGGGAAGGSGGGGRVIIEYGYL